MKKIAVDVRMINASGIGVVIRNILPVFFDHYIVFLIGNRENLEEYKNYKNVNIIHVKASIYSVKLIFLYPFFKKVDLLWIPHFNIPIVSNASKVICTIHDTYHLDNANKLSLFERIYARFFYYWACYNSDYLFTVSQFSKNRLIEYFPFTKNKIDYVYNGVKFSQKSVSLQKEKRYILFVGNFKPHKNIKTLVQAYQKLSVKFRKKYPLAIVGKIKGFINGENHVFELIDNKDNIFIFDSISDKKLEEVYNSTKLFVMPSKYEGFGLPILESFYMGIPVICSNIEVFKEICLDAALYFDNESSEDLKEKIENLLLNNNLQEILIDKGRERLSHFNWEEARNLYLQKVKELIGS